jgi:uncharacterized protein (TIGR03083 family)
MPPAARRPRRYDPAKTGVALVAQVRHVLDASRDLDAKALAGPSELPGWTVHQLLVHIARQIEVVPDVLERAAPGKADLDLARWARSTATIADRLDEDTREAAAATERAVDRIEAAADRLNAVLDQAVAPDRLIAITLGSMRSTDFLVTRLVELVVHSDDLATATAVAVPLDRQAVAAVVRLLADALADKAPGNSVEVRVPPYAAVQCVPGPRHTRGTPPNVIETDPLTWIRLATGRTTWAAALGSAAVSASGERADLGLYLPVLG